VSQFPDSLPADGQSPPPPGPPARISVPLPRPRPRVTYALLLVTGLVFLGQTASSALTGQDLLLALGAKVNDLIRAGQYWRLATPIFLHAGLLHIGFNLYALYIIGPPVEARFGPSRFLFLYFFSGVSGVLASMAFSSDVSVGASGAIFGLIGAYGVFLYQHRKVLGEPGRRTLLNLVFIAVVNLLIGLAPGIDDWGHLGGLVGGSLIALGTGPLTEVAFDPLSGQPVVRDRRPAGRVWAGSILLLLVLLGIFTYLLVR
jgi:rhomboid protease GluP